MKTDLSSPKAVMDAYTTGTRDRDVDRLAALFHADAVMTGYLGPDKLVGGTQPFLDAMTNNPADADYRSEVDTLVIDGKIANATVREKGLLGLDFVNHFHMLEEDGEWRITSKAFSHS